MQAEKSSIPLQSENKLTETSSTSLLKSSETMISNWINNKLKKKHKNEENAQNEDKGLFSNTFKQNNLVKVIKSVEKIKVKNESCTTKDLKSKSCTKMKSESNWGFDSDGHLEIVETYKFLSDKLESKSKIGLIESVEIYNQIEESKINLIEIMRKYIQNETFANDLLNVLTNHTKLQIESETRTQKLTHEMWLNQCEMMEQEQLELREDLSLAIKHNFDLQTEVESLEQKNEQLCLNKSRDSCQDFGNQLMETLCANNEKLRQKVNILFNQIKRKERELQLLRNENQSLEKKLRNSNSQLCTYRNNLGKLQFGGDVERIQLTNQLQLRENLIKESFEGVENFFKELAELKPLNSVLNYTKIENCERSLPDLIYNYGTIAIKVAKELSFAQTEIGLKDKEIKHLGDELEQSKQSLQESKIEQTPLNNLLQSQNAALCEEQLKQAKEEHERQNEELKRAVEKTVEFKKKLIENEEEAFLNKEKMLEYKSENDSLRMQLHGLKQVMNSSRSGDVARELVETQEKMTCFQSQYYQLLSEKNYLLLQIQAGNQERENVNQNQTNYYQFIQTQQNELGKLNSNFMLINKELDQKTQEVSSLLIENNKLKEEKDAMKQIYQQLKGEIKRAQKLQSEVAGMNMEANRLTIIAQYNKQLGEKLQCEVAERDEKISELESNVTQLNNLQIESSKDKTALCVELKEICSINSELNNSLAMEQKKIFDLDQCKRALEGTTSKLKALQDMQKVEREAMRELLKDYKSIVVQRDNLVVSQNELIQQINDLGANSLIQAKTIEKFNKKYLHNQECKAKLNSLEEAMKNVQDDLIKSENFKSALQEKFGKVLEDNEQLESSKAYLQNNMQKLQVDLDETRRSHIELEKKLSKESDEVKNLTIYAKKGSDMVRYFFNQNSQLMQQMAEFKDAYCQLQQECRDRSDIATKSKIQLQQTIAEMENVQGHFEQEKRILQQKLIQKEFHSMKIENYCDHLNEKLSQISCSVQDVEHQSKLLSESSKEQEKLQKLVAKIQQDQQKSIEIIKHLETEKIHLEEQFKKIIENTEAEFADYKANFESFVQEEANNKKIMVEDFSTLCKSFHDMENNYLNKCNEHSALMDSHKDLAAKLLKAVTLLIDEKLNQQKAENKTDKLSNQIIQLTSENEFAQNTIKTLTQELNELQRNKIAVNSTTGTIKQFLIDLQEISQQTDAIERVNEEEQADIASVYSNNALVVKSNYQEQLSEKEEKIRLLSEEIKLKHQKITELQLSLSDINNQLNDIKLQKCEVFLQLHEETDKLETESNRNKDLVKIQSNISSQVSEMAKEGLISETAFELLKKLIQYKSE